MCVSMKTTIGSLLAVFCITCTSAIAGSNVSDRIEEILSKKVFSPDGKTLITDRHAIVEGCAIRLKLEKPYNCQTGPGAFLSTTDYIDLQALDTNRNAVEFKDLTGTPYESLGGTVRFHYKSLYNLILRIANNKASQILDEEYKRYPTDVESRLRVLSKRYSEEITPLSYYLSIEETQFCSGTEVKNPLHSGFYLFVMKPSEMTEFATLIEQLSQDCVTRPIE